MELTKPEIVAALTALVGTIVFLWRLYHNANIEIKDLVGKYHYLDGRQKAVESLSKAVLDRLDQRRKVYDDGSKESSGVSE